MAAPKEKKRDEEILRETIIKKFNSMKKDKITTSLVDDFGWTFKVFLKKHFNITYEFTHEELLKEISKTKIKEDLKKRIEALSSFLEEIKYGNLILSKEHFKWMVDEGKNIINLAIRGKEFTEEQKRGKMGDKTTEEKKITKIKEEEKSEVSGIIKGFFGKLKKNIPKKAPEKQGNKNKV